MLRENKGTIVVNKELEIISTDQGYRDYVNESDSKTVFANIHPDDQHLLYEMVEALDTNSTTVVCFRICDRNGKYRWVNAECELSGSDYITIAFQDISNIDGRARAAEQDSLTGLYNKMAITEYVRKECEHNKARNINLVIIDIDNFKQLNDTMGHAYGDKILREVAGIVIEVLGNDGRAGRVGGDEIMLVIENMAEKTDLRIYLKSIRERVESSHIDQNGFPLVTVSMGIGTFPTYVDNFEGLYSLAERMLQRAKSRGKNRYVIYNPDIHGAIIAGELDESLMELSGDKSLDKKKLVLDSLDGLFCTMNEAITSLIKKISVTYCFEQVYVFYKDLGKSFYGYKRTGESSETSTGKVLRIVDNVSEFIYVTEPGFESRFDAYGVLIVDNPDEQLKESRGARRFFTENGITWAFLYKMQSVPYDGFIVFYYTSDNHPKLTDQDINNLTYLCRMMEIAIKIR
ncbi:MAG: sensor domain-containing diguanylate cyclase [Butyrivibrio sp.]|nr:sensor domain-containing diguanylate cyclase [Butyrivibrio sp.]